MRAQARRASGFLALLLCAAALCPAREARSGDDFKPPWSLDYQDGSGNSYHFEKDSKKAKLCFTYSPVQPAESSSGLYSGGAPRQGCLNGKQSGEFTGWISKLEADTKLHTPTRMKGTGRFEFQDNSETKSFIVKGEKPLRQFDDFLKKLR